MFWDIGFFAIVTVLFWVLAFLDRSGEHPRLLHLRAQPMIVLLFLSAVRIIAVSVPSAVLVLPVALLIFSLPVDESTVALERKVSIYVVLTVGVVAIALGLAPVLIARARKMWHGEAARRDANAERFVPSLRARAIWIAARINERLILYRETKSSIHTKKQRSRSPYVTAWSIFWRGIFRYAAVPYAAIGLYTAYYAVTLPSLHPLTLESQELESSGFEPLWFLGAAALASVLLIDFIGWVRGMFQTDWFRAGLLLATEAMMYMLVLLLAGVLPSTGSPSGAGLIGGAALGLTLAIWFDMGLAFIAIFMRLTDPGVKKSAKLQWRTCGSTRADAASARGSS